MIDKREAARRLALAHYCVESGLERVFRLASPEESDTEPIKLLEVNRDSVATGILPLGFAAAPIRGIPFSSVIVEVTPAEFEKIRSGELTLPGGWQMVEEIPNETPVAAAV